MNEHKRKLVDTLAENSLLRADRRELQEKAAELEAEVERLKSQNHKLKAQLGPSDQEIREQGFRDYGHDIGF